MRKTVIIQSAGDPAFEAFCREKAAMYAARASAAAAVVDTAADDAAPKRTRRRRSPREVMDALGSETDNSAE